MGIPRKSLLQIVVLLTMLSCQHREHSDAGEEIRIVTHDLVTFYDNAELLIDSTSIDLRDERGYRFTERGFSDRTKSGCGVVSSPASVHFLAVTKKLLSPVGHLSCRIGGTVKGHEPLRMTLSVNGGQELTFSCPARKRFTHVMELSEPLRSGENELLITSSQPATRKTGLFIQTIDFDSSDSYKTDAAEKLTLPREARKSFLLDSGESVCFVSKIPLSARLDIRTVPLLSPTPPSAAASDDCGLSVEVEDTAHEGTRALISRDAETSCPQYRFNLKHLSGKTVRLCITNAGKKSLSVIHCQISGYPGGGKNRETSPQGVSDPASSIRATRSADGDSRPGTLKGTSLVLYVIDALRADRVGCYGYPRSTTPFLDRLSRQSFLFTNAQTNSTWTRPSMASILTGLVPTQHSVIRKMDRLPVVVPYVPALLQKAGVRTSAFLGNGNVSSDFGFDRGFDMNAFSRKYQDDTPLLIDHCLRYLSSEPVSDSDKDSFLYLHTMDTHDPYLFHDLLTRLFLQEDLDGEDDPQSPGKKQIRAIMNRFQHKRFRSSDDLFFRRPFLQTGEFQKSDEIMHVIAALYDGALRWNDMQFARLYRTLIASQIMTNPTFIILSDHGEEFFDHGGIFHGHTTYHEVMHVPLIIHQRTAGIGSNCVSDLISLQEIAPLVLNLFCGEQGRKLEWIIKQTLADQPEVHIGFSHDRDSEYVTMIKQSQKLITRLGDQRTTGLNLWHDEIYDLVRDPQETTNSIAQSRMTAHVLFNDLIQSLFVADSVRFDAVKTRTESLGDETRMQLQQLGYLDEKDHQGAEHDSSD